MLLLSSGLWFQMVTGVITTKLFTETIAPVLGIIISNGIYLTGVPAIQKARADSTLGDLNPLPFAMSLANSLAWCGYGFVTKNPFIIFSDAMGIILGLYNTMTGVWLADDGERKRLE